MVVAMHARRTHSAHMKRCSQSLRRRVTAE
jgi:hypothetical protein